MEGKIETKDSPDVVTPAAFKLLWCFICSCFNNKYRDKIKNNDDEFRLSEGFIDNEIDELAESAKNTRETPHHTVIRIMMRLWTLSMSDTCKDPTTSAAIGWITTLHNFDPPKCT